MKRNPLAHKFDVLGRVTGARRLLAGRQLEEPARACPVVKSRGERRGPKRITFEFVGGRRDGRTISSDSSDRKEAFEAECFFLMTERGEVGRRFIGLADYAKGVLHTQGLVTRRSAEPEKYEVFMNLKTGSGIQIRCRSVSEKAPAR